MFQSLCFAAAGLRRAGTVCLTLANLPNAHTRHLM